MKSVYIHIPFCEKICSYCDFSKLYYNSEWVKSYLIKLEKEIQLKYKGELINTLYIGGGTPSCLNVSELKELFKIIKIFNLDNNIEFTIECNIENIDEEKMKIFKENGINRLSIGVQTFNPKYLKLLDRNHTEKEVFDKINIAKKMGFNNINVDLIYALPDQTLEELKKDIDVFLNLNIEHISPYSLIIEPHTKMYINNINQIEEELDYDMYNYICATLTKNNYQHYEISNFSKLGYNSKHNLTYWNNDEYYGFGLGASGYINKIRYDNTKSLNQYLNDNYCLTEKKIEQNEEIENAFILGFRKIDGINKKNFKQKYYKNINDIKVIKKLIDEEKLIDDGKNVYVNKQYIYMSNEILINFIGEHYE